MSERSQSSDEWRRSTFSFLVSKGWTKETAAPLLLALSPFDEAYPPQTREFSDFARSVATTLADKKPQDGDQQQARDLSLAALQQIRSRAKELNEPYYSKRYDSFLPKVSAPVTPEQKPVDPFGSALLLAAAEHHIETIPLAFRQEADEIRSLAAESVTPAVPPQAQPNYNTRYAGPFKRIIAHSIDGIVRLGIGLIAFASGWLTTMQLGSAVLGGVVTIAAYIFMELSYGVRLRSTGRGQTFGERAAKIRLVNEYTLNGLSRGEAIKRTIIYGIWNFSCFLVFPLLSYLWIVFGKKHQAWYDSLSNIVMVRL